MFGSDGRSRTVIQQVLQLKQEVLVGESTDMEVGFKCKA